MKTLILTIDDIRQIVEQVGLDTLMDRMIDNIDIALRDFDPATTTVPARRGFNYTAPFTGLIEWMPVMKNGDQATVKMVGYHPENPNTHNLPTILATVSAYDTHTGRLVGLADATFLTAVRTGAASAVATKYLAHPDASVVGLIGCGAQAISQLHALSRVMDIDAVYIYDTDPAVTRTFASRAAFMGLEIISGPEVTAEAVLKVADVLCTATSNDLGNPAVFAPGEHQPWLHINAIGSDFPGKTELPLRHLEESFVTPDFKLQALHEGECQQMDPNKVGPELSEILRAPEEFESVRYQSSVFDSTGFALEDQVALNLMLKLADECGLGTPLQIENNLDDPYHPYAFTMDHVLAVAK